VVVSHLNIIIVLLYKVHANFTGLFDSMRSRLGNEHLYAKVKVCNPSGSQDKRNRINRGTGELKPVPVVLACKPMAKLRECSFPPSCNEIVEIDQQSLKKGI